MGIGQGLSSVASVGYFDGRLCGAIHCMFDEGVENVANVAWNILELGKIIEIYLYVTYTEGR